MRLPGLSAYGSGACLVVVALAGGAFPAAGQAPAAAAYEARLERYRSGDFVGAIQDAMAVPWRDFEDQAEAFLDRWPGRTAREDLALLAAALFHLDLAGPAGVRPEDHETMARRFVGRIEDDRGAAWLRDSHLGLLGFLASRSRWADAVRVAEELRQRFGEDPAVRLARARLAEVLGWGLHDERFLDQAQFGYAALLEEAAAAGAASTADGRPDPNELRLRLAHLRLREGNPESALEMLAAAGEQRSALFRFVAGALRGETLLWLERAAEAEAAFAEAHAVHSGSISAAAGLAVARQMLGDPAGGANAVRRFLADTDGADAWRQFLHGPLNAETERLDRLRSLVLVRVR